MCVGPRTSHAAARWLYLTHFVVTVIIAWVLRNHGADALSRLYWSDACDSEADDADAELYDGCIGKQAVLRVCFGSTLVYATLALACIRVGSGGDGARGRAVLTGCWALKAAAWLLAVLLAFFLPSDVFRVYGQAGKALGALFIVVQVILLLDGVFRANERLLAWRHGAPALVLASGAAYAGSIVGIAFAYALYAPSAGCSMNIAFATSTLLAALAYTALSVSPVRIPQAGLLTSGATFAYATFLLWGALKSEPRGTACTPAAAESDTALQAVSFALVLLSMLSATASSAAASAKFDLAGGGGGGGYTYDDGEEGLPYRPDFFHAVYALAASYSAMVLTGWSVAGATGDWDVDVGYGSTWVKMASQWLCTALYVWILIAPRVLHGRAF